MSKSYLYTFPALKGTQASREYFVAMCPLKLLPKLFIFDEEEIPPELRAQRTLNVSRIPEITRYLVENDKDYAFSAITASIDGEISFLPAEGVSTDSDIGHLQVSMNAKLVINDGQHRRAAIEAALHEKPELGEETIAVVFFVDADLKRSQQLFADLNKHAVRPTKSLGILYDCRDPMAKLARDLSDAVPIFKGLTEKEKTSISNRSIKLFTLSAIYQATQDLLSKKKGEEISRDEVKLASKFWNALGRIIPEYQLVVEKEVSTTQLRRDFVHSHGVGLHALGIAGGSLIKQYPNSWEMKLLQLRDLDWRKTNVVIWEGRAVVAGHMSKARQNLNLTAILLKRSLGLELSPEEIETERIFQSSKDTIGLNPDLAIVDEV